MEEAFIVVFVRVLLHLLGLMCGVWALPTAIALSVSGKVFAWSRRPGRWPWWSEPLLWGPRWLLVTCCFSCACAQIVVPSRLFATRVSLFTGLLCAGANIAALVYGNWFARAGGMWVYPTEGVALWGELGVVRLFVKVQGDLLAFLGLVAGVLTGVRVPSLLAYAQERNRGREPGTRLNTAARQALMEPLYALLQMLRLALFMVTVPWRWAELRRSVERVWTFAGEAAFCGHPKHGRFLVLATLCSLEQVLASLLDLPVFAVMVLLWPAVPWRLETAIAAMRAATNADARRVAAFRIVRLSFIDLVCLVFGIVVSFTWRGPCLWRSCVLAQNAAERRAAVFTQLKSVIVDLFDLPHAVMALLLVVMLWRAVPLLYSLSVCHTRQEARKAVRRHFFLALVDIPVAALAMAIVVTVWRAPNLWSNLVASGALVPIPPRTISPVMRPRIGRRRLREDSDCPDPPPPARLLPLSTWHRVVIAEFTQLMIDTPFPIVSVFTLWRLPFLIRAVVRKCHNAGERRRMVLFYLMLLIKDVPAALACALIAVTVWRVPTLIREIAQYEEGDDEHQIVFGVLKQLLRDVPYVCLGIAAVVLSPWRIAAFVRGLREGQTDRRTVAIEHFKTMIGDYASAVVMLLVFITGVRARVWLYHANNGATARRQDSGFIITRPVAIRPSSSCSQRQPQAPLAPLGGRGPKTMAFYRASSLAATGLVLDVWVVFMMMFIAGTVFHLPPLFHSIASLLRLHKGGDPQNGGFTPEAVWDFRIGTRQRNLYGEPPESPLSLVLFEPAVSTHFFSSIRDLPHVFLLPLKAIGLLSWPLYAYASWRFPRVERQGKFKAEEKQKSPPLVVQWLAVQTDRVTKEWDFWSLHKVAVRMAVVLLLLIAHDVSLVILPVNVCLLLLCTLGFPAWSSLAPTMPDTLQTFLRSAVFCCTALFVPVVFVVDVFVALFPTLLWLWKGMPFSLSVLASLGISQFFTLIVTESLFTYTNWLAERWFEWFSPAAAYSWLVDEFMKSKAWKFYTGALERITEWGYNVRRLRFLFLGELFLFPAVFFWSCWPVIVAVFFIPAVPAVRPLYILIGVQVSVFLLHRAYHLVRRRWRRLAKGKTGQRPEIELQSFVPVLLPGSRHGFAVEVRGTKSPRLSVLQARLLLRGDRFWSALSTVMGPFWSTVLRHGFHPMALCPTFLDPITLSEGITDVNTRFVFGIKDHPKLLRVSHNVLKSYLEKTVAAVSGRSGGLFVDVVVDYGEKSWGVWVINGRLISLRLDLKEFLRALVSHEPVNLVETGAVQQLAS